MKSYMKYIIAFLSVFMIAPTPSYASAAYPTYPGIGTPVDWVNPLAEDVADDITSDYLTFKDAFKMLGDFLNGLFNDVKADNQARYEEMRTALGAEFLSEAASLYGIYSKTYYSAIQLNLHLLGFYPEDILLYMNVEKDKAKSAKEIATEVQSEGNLTGSLLLNQPTGTEYDNFSLWYRQNVSFDGEKFTVREKVLNPLNYTFTYKYHSFTDVEGIYTYVPAAYKPYFKAMFDENNADMSKAKMDYLLGIGKIGIVTNDIWSKSISFQDIIDNPWLAVDTSRIYDKVYVILNDLDKYSPAYKHVEVYYLKENHYISSQTSTSFAVNKLPNEYIYNYTYQYLYTDLTNNVLKTQAVFPISSVSLKKDNNYSTSGLQYLLISGTLTSDIESSFTYQPTIPVYDIRTQGMSFANVGSPVDVPIEEDENDNVVVPPGTLPGLPDEVGDPSIPDTSLWPLNDILTGVNTGVQNIVDRLDESTALGRIIAESMAYDEDSERRGRMLDVSIPNFLLLLLLILINILYLIMKAFVIATKILRVDASTVLFNDDVVAAIERTKDLTIGGFNLSIYDMLSWLVIFVFTFAIVGVLRKYLDGMKV